MKLKRVDALLYQSLFLVLTGIIVARVTALNSMSSLLFTLTFPLTVAVWLRSVRQGLTPSDWVVAAVILMSGFHVLLNLIISGGSFSISYFKKLIMFYMTILFLAACHKTVAGRKTAGFIHTLADVTTLFYIFMYVFFFRRMHMLNGVQTKYVSFRFMNPNLTAMFLVCLYMLQLCRLFLRCRDLREKKIRYALVAILAWFVFDTRSRNGQLVMLLFSAVAFLYKYRLKIKQKLKLALPMGYGKIISVLLSIVPFVFAVIYMCVISGDWVQVMFGFMSGEGKGLDSRVKVWEPAMLGIGDAPWLGSYYAISQGTGQSQMHNSHLDMAASYGLPVMLLVSFLLAIYIWNRGKKYRRSAGFLYMFAFCCTLMLGVFEASMFSGGLGVYIYMGMFLLLANSEAEEREKKT